MMHAIPGVRPSGFSATASNTLFFVDHEVSDSEHILSGVTRGTIIKRLPRTGDALDAIASFAEIRTAPVDRIVILSHGTSGALRLSGQDIDSTALRDAGGALSRIRETLSPKAEIVLMACSTGAGSSGRTFLKMLSISTGATVTASDADIDGRAGWSTLPTAVMAQAGSMEPVHPN